MKSYTASILMITVLVMALTSFAQQPPTHDTLPPIETTITGETGEGYIYLSNFERRKPEDIPQDEWITYPMFLLIVDNDGEIMFRQHLERRASHFRAYPDQTMIYHDRFNAGRQGGVGTDGPFIVLDANGDELTRYTMQGYTTSLHEFLKLDNGNVMMLSYDERIMDMSAYDGHPEAIVSNVVIQELDPDQNVVWEWSGWDHFAFEDTVRPNILKAEPPNAVDYVHPNGLELDLDGNLLLSSKHLDEITKINRETGDIMWRMGGFESTANQFTFIDDPFKGFSAQHHPVVLENGNLLLFDNGTAHNPQESRAVEYELDRDNLTARMVWDYRNGQYAPGMGSVQRLENGNTLIGWGSSEGVAVSEVSAEGEVVFELRLPETQISYRAYRLPFYGELRDDS